MSPQIFVVLLLSAVGCIVFAHVMAVRSGRSPKLWTWLAAILGPLPLAVLAILPYRRS